MTNSLAYHEFRKSLNIVEELLKIEGTYSQPPSPAEMNAVLGLKGGASVLMVGAFEYYLRKVFEEHLSELKKYSWIVPLSNLHSTIQETNVFNSLHQALNPPPHLKKARKFQEIPEITRVCVQVASGNIIPSAFSNTRNNPTPNIVAELFNNVGIKKIFKKVEKNFVSRWGSPISDDFIPDKLDEIVQRRHKIAHGQILNVTRQDLLDSVKFLDDLSFALDNTLGLYVTSLILMNNPHYLVLSFLPSYE